MDAVLQRELKVTNDYHTAASKLDERYHGTAPEVTGPIEAKLNTYSSGKFSGIVVGGLRRGLIGGGRSGGSRCLGTRDLVHRVL